MFSRPMLRLAVLRKTPAGSVGRIHSAAARYKSDTIVAAPQTVGEADASSSLENLAHRLKVMTEVTVSKIFPAGVGWQTASVWAESAGFAATETPFFLATGLGDFVGVFLGHSIYFSLKRVLGWSVNLHDELQTALFLGSAAFCSGCVWQPSVNLLTNIGCSFNQTMIGTGAVCGLAFFAGLRIGRSAYPRLLPAIEPANYSNLKSDAGLSVSIGGATAFFVGTDVSFGNANWLQPIVGISDSLPALEGVVRAGTSTALGFLALQSVQSVALKQGKCWVD